MNIQHTPGPWEFAEASSWNKGERTSLEYFVRLPGDDIAIASDVIDPKTQEPSEANARLIATAPELLALLEGCLPTLDDERERAKLNYKESGDLRYLDVASAFGRQSDAARAIIAKAKGEEGAK